MILKYTKFYLSFTLLALYLVGCKGKTKEANSSSNASINNIQTVVAVDPSLFVIADELITITKVPCTLSDGSETDCFQIVTKSIPSDHQMGPWCPENIADSKEAGGIWLKDGEVYDVDGSFVENMGALYEDTTWQMYDADGNIYVTETEQDCIDAANPNVGEAYENFCVECLPSYITEVSQTFLIPVKPAIQEKPVLFSSGPRGPKPDDLKDHEAGDRPPGPKEGGPRGPKNDAPSTRGIALNGVEFSAPAPLDNILSAYTLAPFDDAGGHINVHQGYHYHAATGLSTKVKQEDGHAALIGYALDGHAIYELEDADGNIPTDLDELRGHYDAIRGYHYHVDQAGNNNFINGLKGAYAM